MDLKGIGDVAVAVGVSEGTIRNWTDEGKIRELLSQTATRTGSYENAKERRYTIDDIYILHTINIQKNRNNTWADVIEYIKTNGPNTDLPASASLILPTLATNFADKLILRQQLETALQTIEDLRQQLEESNKKADEIREEERGRERQYLKEMGRMEFEIETLKKRIQELEDK